MKQVSNRPEDRTSKAFTRLTNGFSKKVEAHANAVALHFMHYFARIHATLRMTPAMGAGVTGKLWEIGDIVALIEAKEAERPMTRGDCWLASAIPPEMRVRLSRRDFS